MSRHTTLKDIANLVGVSTATVSNVLNGRYQRVSRKTIELVRNAVKESGYQPDALARGLATKRSDTLGLVVAGIKSHLFTQAVYGAEETAARFGYNVILCCNRGDEENEARAVQSLVKRRIDAIVFISSSGYKRDNGFRLAVEAGIPVVVINRCIDPDHALHILAANEQAAYDATVHLVDLGHRKIGYIHLPIEGPNVSISAVERMHGFKRALSDYGLPFVSAWVRSGGASGNLRIVDVTTSSIATEMLSISERPTALLCGSDYMAANVLRAAAAVGLRVPEDLAVIGHDDTPTACYTTPPLTSIRQPFERIGARAVEAAVQSIWKETPLHGVERLACELVVRNSSA